MQCIAMITAVLMKIAGQPEAQALGPQCKPGPLFKALHPDLRAADSECAAAERLEQWCRGGGRSCGSIGRPKGREIAGQQEGTQALAAQKGEGYAESHPGTTLSPT